jgi:hypothetical protein
MSPYSLAKYRCPLLLTSLLLLVAAAPALGQPGTGDECDTDTSVAATTSAAPPAQPPTHPYITVASAAAPQDDEGWQGSFAFYGFLSSFDGELRAQDRVVEVDRSFGDIADVLKFAAGLRVEAEKDNWGFAFDNNYFKVGDDVTTDRTVTPDFRFDLAMNITEIEPSYRFYSSGEQDDPVGGPRFAVDLIGGVRIAHISTDLEIRRLIADDVFNDRSATYVHGYIGNEIVASPSKYVTLSGRYNVALASDFSWFLGGFVDVRPWEHFSIGGGLQLLDLSLEDDSKDAALDARFFGPTVHMKFHF